MQYAGDHPPVIHAPGTGWFLGKCGSIANHASSDNRNSAMPAPPMIHAAVNQESRSTSTR